MKCAFCSKEFPPSKYNPRKKSCSKVCGRKLHYQLNIERERANCKKWYLKNRETEIEKNKKYREENKELFNWYHNKDRFSGLREEIIKRDNNSCKACGNNKKDYLTVHHIDGNGYTKKKKINNSIDNLLTLCKSCHSKLHRWQEKNEFLKTDEDIVRTLRKLREVV